MLLNLYFHHQQAKEARDRAANNRFGGSINLPDERRRPLRISPTVQKREEDEALMICFLL